MYALAGSALFTSARLVRHNPPCDVALASVGTVLANPNPPKHKDTKTLGINRFVS